MNLKSRLLSLPVSSYIEFKTRRNQLVSEYEMSLIKMSEEDLVKVYDNWESIASHVSTEECDETCLDDFTVISLIFYFQRDIIFLKLYGDYLINTFHSPIRLINRCGCKVLVWIVKESCGGDFILKRTSEMIKQTFKQGPEYMYFNACNSLSQIRQLKRYDLIIEIITENYQELINIVFTQDEETQKNAIRLFRGFIKRVPLNSILGEIKKTFDLSIKYLNSKETVEIRGALMLLTEILYKHSDVFKTQIQPIFPKILIISKEQTLPIDEIVCKFLKVVLSSMPDTFPPKFLQKLFKIYIKELIISTSYISVFNEFVKNFVDRIDTKIIFQNMAIGAIEPDQLYPIINTILDFYPDYVVCINFLQGDLTKDLISILKKQDRATELLKPKIIQCFNENFQPTANEDQLSLGLSLVFNFSKLFFPDIHSCLSALEPYKRHPIKSIREQLIDIAAKFKSQDSNEFLLYFAIYDGEKSIRLKALKSLALIPQLAFKTELFKLLYDSSYKVRCSAIEVLTSIAKYNPLEITPLLGYYSNIMIELLNEYSEPQLCTKIASLMPYICKFKTEMMPDTIEYDMNIYFAVLTSKQVESSRKELLPIIPIDHYPRDKSFFVKEPKHAKLYQIHEERFATKRDIHIVHALEVMAEQLYQYYPKVLTFFGNVFDSNTKNDKVIFEMMRSINNILYGMMRKANSKIRNIVVGSATMDVLSETQSEKIALEITKFMGNAFDDKDVFLSHLMSLGKHTVPEINHPDFFIDYILQYLIRNFGEQFLSTITILFQYHPQQCKKYILQVLPLFLKMLEESGAKHRNHVFHYLEVITSRFPSEIQPLKPSLLAILIKYIDITSCIRLCACLSFYHMSSFIPEAIQLFLPALDRLGANKIKYFTTLLQFITFTILYQNQSFELFIKQIERRQETEPYKLEFIEPIFKSVMTLYKNLDLSFFNSRLAQFCFKFIRYDSPYPKALYKLVTETLPLNCMFNYPFPNNDDQQIEIEAPHFEIFQDTSILDSNCDTSFFNYLKFPSEATMHEWFADLYQKLIEHSPLTEIRACSTLSNHDLNFKKYVFPCAFLSCWKASKPEERKNFSKIVNQILRDHKAPQKFYIDLIKTLDTADMPLDLDIDNVANNNQLHHFALYMLEKEFLNNPQDMQVLNLLLTKNYHMGKWQTLKGLYKFSETKLDDKKKAEWCVYLEQWEKAYQFYSSNNENNQYLKEVIHTAYNLQKYDEIIKYEPIFEQLTKAQKAEVSIYFAWSYYRKGQDDKVKELIDGFQENWEIDHYIFAIFYYLGKNDLNMASFYTAKGFDMVSQMRTTYGTGFQRAMYEELSYAQLFVEFEETIFVKHNKMQKDYVQSYWKYRIKGYHRDNTSWTRIIALQNTILPIDDHFNYYLKNIAQLRKERRFSIIKKHFKRCLSLFESFSAIIAQIKLLWSKNKCTKAVSFSGNIFRALENYESVTPESLSKIINERKLFFPMSMLYTLSKTEAFDEELSNHILSGTQYTNLKDLFKEMSTKNSDVTRQTLSDLILTYPEKMTRCFKSIHKLWQCSPEEKSRFTRLYGQCLYSIGDEPNNLHYASTLLEKSIQFRPNDYRSWKCWGYINAKLAQIENDPNHVQYVANSLISFVRAMSIHPEGALEYDVQLSYVIQNTMISHIVPQETLNEMCNLQNDIIFEIIPQMIMNIAHCDPVIRQIVQDSLLRFGKEHFQGIFYSLSFYSHLNDIERSKAASEILNKIKMENVFVAVDADLFLDGMIRSSVTCFEAWMIAIEVAIKAMRNGDMVSVRNILESRFKQYRNPQCELDHNFIKAYRDKIDECYSYYTNGENDLMWASLKQLYMSLKSRTAKLSTVFLSKISEELVLKRNFLLAVPGRYTLTGEYPTIERVDPIMEVLTTQQHPRQVHILSSTGENVKYLLKGNEDLRLDERLMQFFTLANSLFTKDFQTIQIDAVISTYAIIPMTPQTGLISWVTGASTLHQIICEYREIRGISQLIEYDLMKELTHVEFQQLNHLQRMEAFQYVSQTCKANELFEYFWIKASNPAIWLKRRKNFTVTNGLMSIVGYIIGLGDRHPGNIMIQPENGHLIHIDFGETFESTLVRPLFQEKVPFRLTRMLTNAHEGCMVNGVFSDTCETVMTVFRTNISSLEAYLAIFIREPLEKNGSYVTNNQHTEIVDRIDLKLKGHEWQDEGIAEVNVPTQVEKLISIAVNPENYVCHYSGWCPFW